MQPERVPPADAPLPPPPPPAAATPFASMPYVAAPVDDRPALRDLAARQRWAIVAGLANAIGGALVYGTTLPSCLGSILTLGVVSFVMFAAFQLARRLYSTGAGIVCAGAMLFPVVWIGVLIFLCSKASKQLKAAGIHVGFFGADPNKI